MGVVWVEVRVEGGVEGGVEKKREVSSCTEKASRKLLGRTEWLLLSAGRGGGHVEASGVAVGAPVGPALDASGVSGAAGSPASVG